MANWLVCYHITQDHNMEEKMDQYGQKKSSSAQKNVEVIIEA